MFFRRIILPGHIGILVRHCKGPYEPTSTIGMSSGCVSRCSTGGRRGRSRSGSLGALQRLWPTRLRKIASRHATYVYNSNLFNEFACSC